MNEDRKKRFDELISALELLDENNNMNVMHHLKPILREKDNPFEMMRCSEHIMDKIDYMIKKFYQHLEEKEGIPAQLSFAILSCYIFNKNKQLLESMREKELAE